MRVFQNQQTHLEEIGLTEIPMHTVSSDCISPKSSVESFNLFDPDCLEGLVDNIVFSEDDSMAMFSVFFENGKLKTQEFNSNPVFRKLYLEANVIHCLTHLHSPNEPVDMIIDYVILEANLGYDFVKEVNDGVLNYLEINFDNWISSNTKIFEWMGNYSFTDTNISDEIMLLKNHKMQRCLWWLLASNRLFNSTLAVDLSKKVLNYLQLTSEDLKFLKGYEQIFQHQLRTTIAEGYGKADIEGVVLLLQNPQVLNRYQLITDNKSDLYPSIFSELATELFGIDLNSVQLISPTDLIIRTYLEILANDGKGQSKFQTDLLALPQRNKYSKVKFKRESGYTEISFCLNGKYTRYHYYNDNTVIEHNYSCHADYLDVILSRDDISETIKNNQFRSPRQNLIRDLELCKNNSFDLRHPYMRYLDAIN